jgi:hypothetical protein
MLPKISALLMACSVLLVVGCSQSSSENATAASAKGGAKNPPPAQANAAVGTCKEFPVPIYPSHTELSCETGSGKPLRMTAYITSADSVEKVTTFYKAQVQPAGWTVKPMEVESPTHSVVAMEKGNGYATAVINIGLDNKGSRTQIHAYPNGNE